MAEYLSPGVYVEEFDSGPSNMQGVSTSTAGFVGLTEKGSAIGAPKLVTSFSDFIRLYGGYLHKSDFGEYRYLAYAVNQFFSNGGARAYIMRVVPSDAKIAKSKCKDGQDSVISIKAKDPGLWGNMISVEFSPSSKCKTQALEDLGQNCYRVKNAMGFNAGDVVVVEEKANLEYNVIKSIEGNNITFTEPFKGKILDTELLPKTTIKSCNVDITVIYDKTVEKYDFCSMNVTSSDFIEKKLSKSELVNIKIEANSKAVAPFDIVKKVFGNDKAQNSVKIALKDGFNGTKDMLSDADFIGTDKGPGSRTGIQAFLDNNNVNIMCVPGITSANVQLSLVAHCENLGSRFAVLDIPKDSKNTTDVLKHRDIVDSNYCAMYHPWIEVYDPLDKRNIFMPPSGAVLGIYARSDNTRGVHKAPANEVVNNCSDLYCNYNAGEQDILNPKGVNLIRRFPGSGIRVWGARTASSEPLWKYINVRRLFIYLEESIKANTNWVVFEPNDETLWTRVKRTIEIFLEGMWRSGALAGSGAGESYYVEVGPTTMTRDDIENGRLICVIGVAPVKPAEFIVFRITQQTGE